MMNYIQLGREKKSDKSDYDYFKPPYKVIKEKTFIENSQNKIS